MIQKNHPIRRWKQWLALPLLGVLLVAFACERSLDTVAPANTAIPSERIGDVPESARIYTYVEQMPHLADGGGTSAIVTYIQQHLVYPQVPAASQRTGRVFASFTVTDQGEVKTVQIVKGLDAPYDAAVVDAIKQLPRFVPGKQDGTPVNVSFTIPVLFAPTAPASK
jgi:TonB family protein